MNEDQRYVGTKLKVSTHPFQISVEHLEVMHILQTLCDINKLDVSAKGLTQLNGRLTSLVRFTLGFF